MTFKNYFNIFIQRVPADFLFNFIFCAILQILSGLPFFLSKKKKRLPFSIHEMSKNKK